MKVKMIIYFISKSILNVCNETDCLKINKNY